MKRKIIQGLECRWEVAAGWEEPLGVWVPVDQDSLLAELEGDTFERTDEKMPYFATLWPTAHRLARKVAKGPSLEGLRVLDLGCGVGLVGLAAARQGAHVTFLDWESRALALVDDAARENGLHVERMVAADWRDPPDLPLFDVILAADVLYETRNLKPVGEFIRTHLAPGGTAWVADPGRPQARGFPVAARESGLEVEVTEEDGRPTFRITPAEPAP